MPLTNAERQRRYREKHNADAAKRAEYLLKEQERYQNDLKAGKRKLVQDMTPPKGFLSELKDSLL